VERREKEKNSMALPETIVVRRKDILEHFGISTTRFYELTKAGLIRPHRLKTAMGRPYGQPYYLRDDVVKCEQTLREA
jgi:hypothetical protein